MDSGGDAGDKVARKVGGNSHCRLLMQFCVDKFSSKVNGQDVLRSAVLGVNFRNVKGEISDGILLVFFFLTLLVSAFGNLLMIGRSKQRYSDA